MSPKKPVLTVSDLSAENLRKLAAQSADIYSKLEKMEAEKLARQRLKDLQAKYPRKPMREGAVPFKIAVTVDDLPIGSGGYEIGERRKTMQRLIDVLHGHGITDVYGYVNSADVKGWTEVETMLHDWLNAGFKLGNHTETHRGATKLTAKEFINDVANTDLFLAELGIDKATRRSFRFPLLQEGDTPAKRKAILDYFAANGYQVAPVTVDTLDYASNQAYVHAKTAAQKKAAIAKGLKTAVADLPRVQKLSKEVFGRDINHVMLLHIAAINIDMLDQVLGEYEARGAQFVSLDEALKDPVFTLDHGQASPDMASFVKEMAIATGAWDPEPGRTMKYKPATMQRRIRALPPMSCQAIFAHAG